ncbi:acetyl-CoA carboxylase biotin carboxyl carrier protein [Yinghuangia seranimata]|uniref:acetyl-CoA carboxylase biotin carboxyl carrier protein n=1 Tax=Yinghuangia seranimata TaxID=408067 RepID=UPI00248D23C4|nr:biotin/lipoyl-containing protein [Yinghuangia seranimata]MDI2128989.1 hypothetical protein [Yinghuangia seranimata]
MSSANGSADRHRGGTPPHPNAARPADPSATATDDRAPATAGPVVGTESSRRDADARQCGHMVDEMPARSATGPPRRIHLETGGTVVDIEWDVAPAPQGPAPAVPEAGGAHVVAEASAPPRAPEPPDVALMVVRAPTVGTFYHSPDPGAKAFVAVGDTVRAGQTVGILEVMKMMTPITAESAGRVVDVVAPDAQPVEFDQPLIALEPLESNGTG